MTEKETLPIWSLLAPEHAEAMERLFQSELERQKLDALAEFAAGAGHEINNPLAIIGGRAQLLMRDLTNPEHRKHLASILVQVRRAYEMIADVRLFARPPKPEPADLDVSAILKNVAMRFAESVCDINPGCEIAWDLHNIAAEVSVFADPAFLDTIFSAVCKNAIEALAQRGHIKISCEYCPKIHNLMTPQYLPAKKAVVVIEDDGPGIPPEHLPLIFSPYFSGRQAGRGLGFGLSKAWRLLGLMDGDISAENCTPQGARFVITLCDMSRD